MSSPTGTGKGHDTPHTASSSQSSQGSSSVLSRSQSRRSSTTSRKGKERAVNHDDEIVSIKSLLPVNGADEVSHVTEDGEDDEDEPALKYSRVKGQVLEILARDQASTLEVSSRVIAIGTHNGMVHVMTHDGQKVNNFRPHAASITCLRLDEENDFVATASAEGRVVIHSLTSSESYAFDYKRPMRAIALEPGFAKKTTRSFVCGGMAGNLILQEKGWLGYKEQILHSGEGPIWAVEWRTTLIAWANDLGVKIYDTTSGQRIGYIDRGQHAPRAELFKCSLVWKNDDTLVIGWADHVKIVRVRTRHRTSSNLPPLTVEMTAIYQVDCMISGIAQYGSSYIVLAYIPPDTFENEATDDPLEQRRKAANRPELRIIDKGEEINADALSLTNYHLYGCNDYNIVRRPGDDVYYVVSPADVVIVRPRDEVDHIDWLVGRRRYQEALTTAERLREQHGHSLDVKGIGIQYINHLIEQKDYVSAAGLAPRVLGKEKSAWEHWIDIFAQQHQLPAIIPHIPVQNPQLDNIIYEKVLEYQLFHDQESLLRTIKQWPTQVYRADKVVASIAGELTASKNDPLLLECLAELYLANRQPAKALPLLISLRRSDVFDLVREYSLFNAIQDLVLLMVEQDEEVAIELLVNHTHAISVERVVKQLGARPRLLYLYLDALLDKDAQLCMPYSDRLIELYATHDVNRLLPFLRASNAYDLERAYEICREHDFVSEEVFLLGRMGNNKQALMLIIERLDDVQKAIDFAKEQADEDLWEDLLQYSETRPGFIRALLEHVGSDINPIRLIRRIRDGMEVPGLKQALVKILQSANLQISLLEGCQSILESDASDFATKLQIGQTSSARASNQSTCRVCGLPAFDGPAVIYLCRHIIHAACALSVSDADLPTRADANVGRLLSTENKRSFRAQQRELGAKLSYTSAIRVRVASCPLCRA